MTPPSTQPDDPGRPSAAASSPPVQDSAVATVSRGRRTPAPRARRASGRWRRSCPRTPRTRSAPSRSYRRLGPGGEPGDDLQLAVPQAVVISSPPSSASCSRIVAASCASSVPHSRTVSWRAPTATSDRPLRRPGRGRGVHIPWSSVGVRAARGPSARCGPPPVGRRGPAPYPPVRGPSPQRAPAPACGPGRGRSGSARQPRRAKSRSTIAPIRRSSPDRAMTTAPGTRPPPRR